MTEWKELSVMTRKQILNDYIFFLNAITPDFALGSNIFTFQHEKDRFLPALSMCAWVNACVHHVAL